MAALKETLVDAFESEDEARAYIENNFDEDEQEVLLDAVADADFGRSAEDRIAEQVANELGVGEESGSSGGPHINPNAGSPSGDSRHEDDVPGWRRRTVRAFDVASKIAEGGRGAVKASEEAEELEAMNASLPEHVMERENKHITDFINAADISKVRKAKLRDFLTYDVETRRQSTKDDPSGGELLSRPFLSEIFVKIEEYGDARALMRTENVTGKSLELKHVSSKPTVGWFSEGERITDSDLGLGDRVLTPKKLAGITTWTTELQEDQAIALLPTLRDTYAEQFSKKEDEAFLNGDGTASNGGFTGVMQQTTTTETTSGSSIDTISPSDLINALQNLTEFEKEGGTWVMNEDVLHDIEDSTEGDEVVRGINDDEHITRIYGYPVRTAEALPSAGAGSGTRFVVFGNFDRAILGTKRDIQAETSTDGVLYDSSGNVTFSGFQEDSRLIRLTERVGYAIPGVFEDDFVAIKTA